MSIYNIHKFCFDVLFYKFSYLTSSRFCFRVKNWALKFGVDLWEFGRHFTKMNQIQNVSTNIKYHSKKYNIIASIITTECTQVLLALYELFYFFHVLSHSLYSEARQTSIAGRTREYKNAMSVHTRRVHSLA